MKVAYIFLFLSAVCLSCSQNPKHPQADIINDLTPDALTDQYISGFADSIASNLNSYEQRSSLVYLLDGTSISAKRYSSNGTPTLLKTYTDNEGLKISEKDYYFKDNDLILIREHNKLIKQNGEAFQEKLTYFRNNIAFKQELRSAASLAELSKKPFVNIKNAGTVNNEEDINNSIKTWNEVIDGTDRFDLVFDQISPSPDDQYITLKSKTQNGYSARVLVKERDMLVDSLLRDPSTFQDKKLNIKWELKDNEAVYVPVAAKVTSASGLKR